MDTQTLICLAALTAGLLALAPTNVFKICAWNAGTMKIDPWRIKTSASVQAVAQGIRAWSARLRSPGVMFACGVVLLALLAAYFSMGHDELVLTATVVGVPALKQKRSTLLREAEALKGTDGTFKDDAARTAFDAKMAEIDTVDGEIRQAESGQSEYIVEHDPVTGASAQRQRPSQDPTEEQTPAEAAQKAERERVQGILLACRAAKMPSAMYDKFVQEGTVLVEAQRLIFVELQKRVDPNPAPNGGARRVEMGDGDPFTHKRKGIEDALLHRVNPERFKLTDQGREYRGLSLLDIGRVYLQGQGVRTTDMSRMEIAGAALGLTAVRGGMHSTSDFPLLLADVANKSLRADYDAAPQTFMPIVKVGTVPDFKTSNRVQIGDAPALKPVGEHGEFTRGTIEEGREQVQAASYGRVFAITRQALVNDDTDAFSRVPAKFGRMARNLESDLVWYQILKNATMADGNAVFSAAHANYIGAGDIAIGPMTAAVRAMRMQVGLDGTTPISAPPKYLIVGPTKEVQALQFVAAITPATIDNVNPFSGRFEVIVESRLEAGVTVGPLSATGSAYAWYLAADKATIDIVELVFLEGQSGPVIESRIGFDVDGLEIKCRHDVGAKLIDHRGMFKSDGSDNS